jgi:hypothetical protein
MGKSSNSVLKDYSVQVPLDMDTELDIVELKLIAYAYGIDFEYLMLLYDRLGKDIFYFFYLFSERKITFPSASKMQNLRAGAKRVLEALKKNEKNPDFGTKQETETFNLLKQMYDREGHTIKLSLGVLVNE